MGVRSDLSMKYKNEIVIISIITILILFLKLVNVFQIENGLGYPFTIVLPARKELKTGKSFRYKGVNHEVRFYRH